MSTIKNPLLFSDYFGVDSSILMREGLIDPFLNVDMPLFVDPVLLEKSTNKFIAKSAVQRFRQHFEVLVRLLDISKSEDDAAWKAARRQLDLREPPANGLGYGGNGRSGSSRPAVIREAILRTSKEIIVLGAKDPEMISLMGFFEDYVGADTISDLTTTVIMSDLALLTQDFCRSNGIPLFESNISVDVLLPVYVAPSGRRLPIVLLPNDIVRELPIANDWSDIERAAMENARIRHRVSLLLGGIVRPTIAERKRALRTAALESPQDFDIFLAAVKENARGYDPINDALGYYRLKEIISSGSFFLKSTTNYNLNLGAAEVLRVVKDTIELFKHHVEVGNLWEELWIGDKPKKERASQLIYFAIADAFCKANDIDISPEANMGGGPIDFKFSSGYSARVLVEMKRSSGSVIHGYTKQLEFYKSASRTEFAVFVVINYSDIGAKLDEIKAIRESMLRTGERASEIFVIDATPKASASKRN